MNRLLHAALACAGLLAAVAAPAALARDKDKDPAPTEFSGRVTAEQQKAMPASGYIANEKALTKLWDAWKIKDKQPAVDFDKQIVLVATSQSSKLKLTPKLDDKGDLTVLALATKDLTEDFAYQIVVFSRDKVKTINGKEIGKD
jgi:hypothetical protein